MADIVLGNVNLDVFGGPTSLGVSVDFGQTGTRGSKMWFGAGDPSLTLSGQEILVNDTYINTSTSDTYYGWMYQYIETPGNPTWERQYQILEGMQGVQGFGYAQLQGVQGVQGPRGLQGLEGHYGVDGAQGVQGTQGVQGLNGLYAAQGIQGVQGTQGIQGNQGLQGIQGLIGLQGTQGVQGVQGIQGITGTQGVQGPQGIQGIQGIQGTEGLQGTQGLQGLQGTQGIQGITGTQGLTGIQGLTGSFGGQTFSYVYETSTVDPVDLGSGIIRFNNTLSTATTLMISYLDSDTTDISTFLTTIDDSSSAIKGSFKVTNKDDANNYFMYNIVGSHTHDDDHFMVPVAYITGNGSALTNSQNIYITFARTGDIGDTGAQGIQGVQGTKGVQGLQGLQGPQGTQGVQGVQGPQGTTGIQGLQGIQGLTGSTLKVTKSSVSLGTIAVGPTWTETEITSVCQRGLVSLFNVSSSVSTQFDIEVRSAASGAGSIMLSTAGFTGTAYNLSMPWYFEADSGQSMWVRIKNVSGTSSTFTLTSLRVEKFI